MGNFLTLYKFYCIKLKTLIIITLFRLTQDYEKALAEKNDLQRHNHIVS